MIVYKAENKINGKIYIGKTIQKLTRRIGSHLSKGSTSLFPRALKKYGLQTFTISIIDNAESEQVLTEKEKYWIRFYDCKYPNGYNLTEGGEGISGCPRSAETKLRLRIFNTGKRLSEEHKVKIGLAHKGRKPSEVARINMSNAHKGIKLSEATKIKMGIVRSGDKNGGAKLNWHQVREIRELHKTQKYSQQQLADFYQVSRGSVKPIIHNKAWVENI